MSDVYFLEAEGQDKVKIGLSGRVQDRIRELASVSPVPLKLRAIIKDGGRETELSLHDRFSHLRLHGEWFHYTLNDEPVVFLHTGAGVKYPLQQAPSMLLTDETLS